MLQVGKICRVIMVNKTFLPGFASPLKRTTPIKTITF
jgi:hypothetical protein